MPLKGGWKVDEKKRKWWAFEEDSALIIVALLGQMLTKIRLNNHEDYISCGVWLEHDGINVEA